MSEKQLVNNYMSKHFKHKGQVGYQYVKLMLEYLLHKYFENNYISCVKVTQLHKILNLGIPYATFNASINYFLKSEGITEGASAFLIQTIEDLLEEIQNIEILKEEDEF